MISVNVKFCRKATEVFLVLLVLSLLAAYLCIERAFLDDALLPAGQSVYPWTVVIDSDVLQDGSSSVVINDSTFTVDYTMLLTKDFVTPYGSLRFTFVGPDNEVKKLDLSNYKTISFNVKCSPKNILMYTVYSLDEEVTRRVGDEIYRVANTLFSCDEEWERVEIDLMRLEIVNWWLRAYDVDITERNYTLDRVGGFALGSSEDSPLEVPFNVKITELTFHGYDWRFIYGLGVFLFLLWGSYILWCVRQHTRYLIEDVKNRMQKDNALVTYQQLSITPKRDADRKMVLDFVAKEYTDPDLSLETMAIKLGVSRTKINDMLKEGVGYTFTAYLNKLRLTEAARLLSEQPEINVSEIAYSVGYKNVPYFNKLFKNEYGCAPKVFKNIHK